MRLERRTLADAGAAAALAAQLRALVPAGADVREAVAGILADVRERGDTAVVELTRRHDTNGSDRSEDIWLCV